MSNKEKTNKSETAKREEEILDFWNAEKIFEKSLEKEAPKGEFVFYDGPPFATGQPHAGHLLVSSYKDAIGRYKTMRGYTVPRRWGWDCHGLPIENIVEKKLGLKTKDDIEELGVERFNEEAHKSVLTFVDDWKKYIERIGRWVDFDNSYKTMDNTYIESVWWALQKIHEDKRLYEGKKVLMYCPRCETPLSKAETAMDDSYKDVTEEALYVKFKIKTHSFDVDGPLYIVAWTTTPWTLTGNVALAVGAGIDYVLAKYIGEHLIIAKDRLEVIEGDVKIISEFKGSNLVGLEYEPLYEVKKAVATESEKAWSILSADFVTTEEGTGVVHTAPMYGEDDFNFGIEHKLPIIPILDSTGTYNEDAPELVHGMYHKKGGKYVSEDLKERGLVLQSHNHTHSYPFCYRCDTALIYNAISSWFIDIQSVKKKLLKANESITWYPEHLKHGRFKNIVESAPDWTISRNRFWASPLPIWREEEGDAFEVIGSLTELKEKTKKSGNTYIFIRHGEADSNVEHIISSLPENEHHVTEKGAEQIRTTAKELQKKGVTKIIASPLLRTKESAEIIAEELGLRVADIEIDERIQEWQLGDLNLKPVAELRKKCPTYTDRFENGCGTGETLLDMKERIGDFLYDIEEKYENETIVVVGHEYTVWLAQCIKAGADVEACVNIRGDEDDYIVNGGVQEIPFVPIPHNSAYELDLHRPFIDDIELVNKEGKRLIRIPEVIDCWFESGSMPFAAEHYPHENKALFEKRYPGDYISEYIAQTRTWFYYMHTMGVLLFGESSFKNCVATGTILAADGSKMSKSKGNFTDPLLNINTYGADAMRFYMLGSVVMNAEDIAFKDEELREVHNRYINMLWNSYKFFTMHVNDDTVFTDKESSHVLDKWILAKCNKLVGEVTNHMDEYDTVRSARYLRDFVADLSQWYIRRSRDRFKSDDTEDRDFALATTRTVLMTVAKLTAPLTPYIAESIYKGIKGPKESVHLDTWPEMTKAVDEGLIDNMAEVRRLASLALEFRQKAGIKVRQPLAKITTAHEKLKDKAELVKILLDEINVKEFFSNKKQKEEIVLDTELTEELKKEGSMRDMVRTVQAMRKDKNLVPEDDIVLHIHPRPTGEWKKIIEFSEDELKKTAGVKEIKYVDTIETGDAVKIGDAIDISIEKR